MMKMKMTCEQQGILYEYGARTRQAHVLYSYNSFRTGGIKVKVHIATMQHDGVRSLTSSLPIPVLGQSYPLSRT
jgi:hypothetical protein